MEHKESSFSSFYRNGEDECQEYKHFSKSCGSLNNYQEDSKSCGSLNSFKSLNEEYFNQEQYLQPKPNANNNNFLVNYGRVVNEAIDISELFYTDLLLLGLKWTKINNELHAKEKYNNNSVVFVLNSYSLLCNFLSNDASVFCVNINLKECTLTTNASTRIDIGLNYYIFSHIINMFIYSLRDECYGVVVNFICNFNRMIFLNDLVMIDDKILAKWNHNIYDGTDADTDKLFIKKNMINIYVKNETSLNHILIFSLLLIGVVIIVIVLFYF